ncbi:hypothetical protein [Xanthomonas maliensis]|uniref:hypothetical protein n=1 Tax=Xanthomonas maliensis TaxID=1321368 RepID=UPI0003A2A3CB|nr:hypothetical protein [Xanthomonas maliensis]KAB7771045.1 hypothetical protein CKY51_03510 [Xanthomonas maliensis]
MTPPMLLGAMRALLRQGALLERLGLVLLLAALLVLAGTAAPAWVRCVYGISVVAGLLQQYWALRVGLDAELLNAAIDQLQRGETALQTAGHLDQALHALGLRANDASPRDWPARWRGMRGLLLRQAVWLAIQLSALAIGIGGAVYA